MILPFVRLMCITLLVGLAPVRVALARAPEPVGPKKAATPSVQALAATPSRIVLRGRYDEARVLVEGRLPNGSRLDVSGKARLTIAHPGIALVDEFGVVRARGDGRTMLIARLGWAETRVPVEVSGVAKSGPPRFLNDVLPVLTRAGCNMGACHGAQQGKGGFKLSLQGYDPEWDYDAITRMNGARRIARAQPDNSLLLRKPTMRVSHRGGLRLRVGSPEYRILRDWIAGGLPGPDPKEPTVKRLEVIPPVRTLAVGQRQRFIVKAHYSDGSQRDVTAQTLFTASDQTVATVTPEGEAQATGPGEGAVLIRYQALVATARVISPFGPTRQVAGNSVPNLQRPTPSAPDRGGRDVPRTSGPRSVRTPSAQIDRLIDAKLAALGLDASPACSDSDFLRRVYLDLIGVLPTPEETRAFLADRDPNKRERLVEALLERPEYVDFWTMKWGDLLRSSRRLLAEKGMYTFHDWIRRSVAQNKPWDRFAREIILASGSTFGTGPANYYRSAAKPEELAEATSQVFLGVRIQCAKCHNHPYEKWTQNQYYQMAAFFARVRSKRESGAEEQLVYLSNGGEIRHPRTHQNVTPAALDAAPLPSDYRGDRRAALADWLTSLQNPFFAKIIVNRLWRHFMGRGLVEPVDDLRVTNPPSNEALLNWLAQDFVKNGYDLKYMMRTILRTRAYQRSPVPTPTNARDTKYYSHYPFKRLGAEQLMDAIGAATGVPEKFSGYPAGMRATQLPDTAIPSYFLELFGRPARNITCECERTDEPNLGQILHLMNNKGINDRIASPEGRVAQLVKRLPVRRVFGVQIPLSPSDPLKAEREVVEELYLASVSRFPTPAESREAARLLAHARNPRQAAEDLLWALMNSKEFVFNH